MTPAERAAVLDVARRAIAAGLEGRGWRTALHDLEAPPALRVRRATFVTLRVHGDLRGCVGALRAGRPLVEDVAEHAFAAAFQDARFPPLSADEFAALDVHVSILSPSEPLACASEADLLRQIRPGIDGVTLEAGSHLGTLLPSVWTSLPDPVTFVRALKRKAGLPADYWSPTVRVSRYTVEPVA